MPAPDGLRGVLFDWDGTLVDSAQRTYRCYVRVFSGYGIEYDHAAFERTYSPDWYRTYEDIGLAREHWKEADARWISCYEAEASALVPGAREMLERLAAAGIAQGLVSSGDGTRVRREIEALGLGCFFAAVVCGGETARRKPDPEPLLAALERLALPPARDGLRRRQPRGRRDGESGRRLRGRHPRRLPEPGGARRLAARRARPEPRRGAARAAALTGAAPVWRVPGPEGTMGAGRRLPP